MPFQRAPQGSFSWSVFEGDSPFFDEAADPPPALSEFLCEPQPQLGIGRGVCQPHQDVHEQAAPLPNPDRYCGPELMALILEIGEIIR